MSSDRAFLSCELNVPRHEAFLAHDVERPIALAASGFTQLFTKGDLLDIPSRCLHLDHIDVDDPLALVPDSFPTLVECPAFGALESSLTSVKAGRCWIGGGTCKQEWIRLDSRVDGALVAVNVDLLVSDVVS
jgi:hypothetical protein